jgi:hypothetical protein
MQVACPLVPARGGGMFLGMRRAVTTPAFAAVCLLVMATPFETRHALVTLPWQQVTLTELVWMLVALVWIGVHVREKRVPWWRTPVTIPWIAWIALMTVAALFADADRANAMKATSRLALGGLTAWMVATSVASARRMAIVLGVAALTGVVVAVLAALEVWRVPSVLASLDVFRDGERVVGGQVRASSTLQYPTITAVYLELVLCGALGAVLWIGERRGWARAWLGMAVVAALIAGLSLTLTRAAVLAALAGVVLALRWRYQQRGADRGVGLLAAAGVCLACAPLLAGSAETARARWTTEGRQGWYRAHFEAPADVKGRPAELIQVPVTVTNQGRLTWKADAAAPFKLSYHWIESRSTRVVQFDGARTPMPADIEPGARVPVVMQVRLPRAPGDYRIAWDVVQEGRLWFSTEPGAAVTLTAASVAGDLAPRAHVEPLPSRKSPEFLPVPVAVPGRRVLWQAALRMTADHPLLGVGPDNFRFRYGRYLDLPQADVRVHSNNLYLEVLTGGGLLAAGAFVWFGWRLTGVVRTVHRRLSGGAAAAYSGVAAAGAAYLVHGCLDSFLTFTPAIFSSALILGLLVAPLAWTEGS